MHEHTFNTSHHIDLDLHMLSTNRKSSFCCGKQPTCWNCHARQTTRKQTQLEYERSTVKRHIKIGAVNKAIAFYDERRHSATPAAMIY